MNRLFPILCLWVALGLLPSQHALAETGTESENLQVPAATDAWITIAAGAKFRSNLQQRGATLYDSWQLTPVIYFGFFENRLQFLLNSLEYADWVYARTLRARGKIASVSDEPAYETGAEAKGLRNSRPSSWEATGTLEFFVADAGQIDFKMQKDLKSHSGFSAEIMPRVNLPLGGSVENGRRLLQPQIFASLLWGDSRHNDYWYGTGPGHSGLSAWSAGLLITSPARIDPAYPILQLQYYELIGDSIRDGRLVTDKTSGVHLNLTIAFGLM